MLTSPSPTCTEFNRTEVPETDMVFETNFPAIEIAESIAAISLTLKELVIILQLTEREDATFAELPNETFSYKQLFP
jgi:hypothetical protein